jgi:hypothetical protein
MTAAERRAKYTFTGCDPRWNDLPRAERAAHLAFVADEDTRRSVDALPAPRCHCARGWTEDGESCGACGRRLR